mmetsp:Transcript_147305/g.410354  ORF Transcript_147305/g.410354 Transcript_147305/m.410354 type:complete len:171 (-) Transcript_147305:143-655(-)
MALLAKVMTRMFVWASVTNMLAASSDPCAGNPVLEPIRAVATECLAACPQVCQPLAEAITLFLVGGDPKPVICSNKDAFLCVTSSASVGCAKLFDAAESMGLVVPVTTKLLEAMCGEGGMGNETNASDPNATDLNATSTTPTMTTTGQTSGVLRVAIRMGPWLALLAASA